MPEKQRLLPRDRSLDQIARMAQIGWWSYDARVRRVDMSDELAEVLGVAADQPAGADGLLALVHPDDRVRVDQVIAELAREPRHVALEVRVVRRDGAVRHVRVAAEVEHARPGEGRWLGTVQDVTDRVSAEAAREASELRLRRILHEMPVAFAAVDARGIMREWNQEAEHVTGYSREEIVGNPDALALLYEADELTRVRRDVAAAGEHMRDQRYILRRKNGEHRIVSWSTVYTANSVTGALTAIGIDVTDAEREAQRYRTLARHLPNGAVLLYDRDLRYLLVDGSDLGAIGDDPDRMVGRTVFEAASPELAAQLAPIFRAALDGRTDRCEITSGELAYDVTCVPLHESGRAIAGGMALTQNITARVRAERAVREQRERLSRVLDLIPALVVGIDCEGHATFVNPAVERTTGYSAGELIGRSWWDALYPDDERRQVEEMMSALGEAGRLRNHEMVLRSKDGERRTVSWSAQRALQSDGYSEEIVFVGLDVTERNDMQERLVIAERMASVGTLAAGVAHEINNPLSYVLANLALASEVVERAGGGALGGHTGPTAGMVGDDEFRALLSEAREGAQRVAKIVADLRMLSRANEEHTELVDVTRSLDTCLQMAANELRHRAHLIRELRPVPRVMANEARLGQVFLNLIINAAQALPETRARTNVVRLTTGTDESGRVVVTVADNGAGMSPATMRRIFDPFFTTKPIGIGTGLGLAIAHRIVSGFGGEIEVESEIGRGSAFRVLLPAAEPRVEPKPPPLRLVPAPRRSRILVIDDEPFVAHAIRRALEGEHAVIVVSSAVEGLAALASTPYDMILCDVMLPEVSGIDLYVQLAASRPDQARRIVFITGGAFTNRARDFLQQVPNPCLDKPFDPAALLSLINERLAEWGPAR